jgi:hypothetical protein
MNIIGREAKNCNWVYYREANEEHEDNNKRCGVCFCISIIMSKILYALTHTRAHGRLSDEKLAINFSGKKCTQRNFRFYLGA